MPYYSVHTHRLPKLTTEQQQFKQALIDTGEEWSTAWQTILARDPHYFAAYVSLRSVPLNSKRLSRKVQELLMLAIDASCAHLWKPGVRAHTAAAIRAGATKAEVMEVLELTSVLGLHIVNAGVPLLQEVLEEKGQGQRIRSVAADPGSLSPQQQQLRTSLQKRKDSDGGFWASSCDAILALSPAFFEAGIEFTSLPFQCDHQHLDPVTKELVYIAIDSATTCTRQPALKTHIRNALDFGATPEQVMNVFELTALKGAHTVLVGADVLGDETRK